MWVRPPPPARFPEIYIRDSDITRAFDRFRSRVVVGIPEDVRGFIERCVSGLEDLEILLFLQQHDDRAWTAASVAAELGLAVRTSAEVLERLGSRNLLDVKIAHDVLYRYNPGTPDLRREAQALADIYQLRRVAVLRLVTLKAPSAVQTFADAFRIRKRKDHG